MSYDWADLLSEIQADRQAFANGEVVYTFTSHIHGFSVRTSLGRKKVLTLSCSDKPLKLFLEHDSGALVGFAMMLDLGYRSSKNDLAHMFNRDVAPRQ